MIDSWYKPKIDKIFQPLARFIVKSGISPSALTIITPFLVLIACVWFIETRHTVAFCIVVLIIGGFDVLDGIVARLSNRVTKFGGYLDAICDRYVEAMVIISVAYVTGYWILSIVLMAGALMVSYAKARTAMEVQISNRKWPDFMERFERSVIFLTGLSVSSVCTWRPQGHDLFWWTLLILSVLVHLTVLQRIFRAKKLITTRP